MVKLLSKSQSTLFLQCPLKWKYIYIDNIKSLPSSAQQRGINIHSKIENFYKNPIADIDLKNFISFELKRVKEMIKENKFESKYFYPLFQELKLQNEEIGLKGIVDAVYINPKDNKLIIIDWKTGQFHGDLDDYRFELAVYTELIKHSGKIDEEPEYWGIYFTDQDKLFFEKIDKRYINEMYDIMNMVREDMENCIKKNDFPKKENKWCFNCQFKNKCKNA